jgi:hypothetical protein
MNKINLILLLGCFSILFSCGNFKEKFGRKNTSQITFEVSQGISTNAWANQAQQFMIYIVGVNGTDFTGSVPIILGGNGTSATGGIVVPVGYYHGYALAWDGTGLQANVGCWQDNAVAHAIGAAAETVNITIAGTNAACNYSTVNGPFGPATFAAAGNFRGLTIGACNGGTGGSCSPGSPSGSYASSGSVKVVMENYVKGGGQQSIKGTGLQGSCQNFTSGVSGVTGLVPVGSNTAGDDKFLSTTLLFFTSSGCPGTPTKVIRFPGGLLNGSPDATSAVTAGNNVNVDVGP